MSLYIPPSEAPEELESDDLSSGQQGIEKKVGGERPGKSPLWLRQTSENLAQVKVCEFSRLRYF